VRQQLSVLSSRRRQAARDEGDSCNQASDDQDTQTQPSRSQALFPRDVAADLVAGRCGQLDTAVNRLSAGGRRSVARPLTPVARPSGGS
jgi:hypothetical protein